MVKGAGVIAIDVRIKGFTGVDVLNVDGTVDWSLSLADHAGHHPLDGGTARLEIHRGTGIVIHQHYESDQHDRAQKGHRLPGPAMRPNALPGDGETSAVRGHCVGPASLGPPRLLGEERRS